MTVVTNHSDLSQAMRYALTTRTRVRVSTAKALESRGLVTIGGTVGYTVHLTEAGRAARDALLAPLTSGARIRHTQHGKLGRVVAVETGEHYDVVTLRWDGWNADTSGSPAYLEVIADDEPTAEAYLSGAATLDQYMSGTTRQQLHDAGNHETCLRGECDELEADLDRIDDELQAEERARGHFRPATAAPAVETVTITVPRHLADAVTKAWEEAYRIGRDSAAQRFQTLADAYEALNGAVDPDSAPWLCQALVDARDEARTRAARESRRGPARELRGQPHTPRAGTGPRCSRVATADVAAPAPGGAPAQLPIRGPVPNLLPTRPGRGGAAVAPQAVRQRRRAHRVLRALRAEPAAGHARGHHLTNRVNAVTLASSLNRGGSDD